ncbi:hypothetical protein AAC387_Pa03g1350 [Persea americana]
MPSTIKMGVLSLDSHPNTICFSGVQDLCFHHMACGDSIASEAHRTGQEQCTRITKGFLLYVNGVFVTLAGHSRCYRSILTYAAAQGF